MSKLEEKEDASVEKLVSNSELVEEDEEEEEELSESPHSQPIVVSRSECQKGGQG